MLFKFEKLQDKALSKAAQSSVEFAVVAAVVVLVVVGVSAVLGRLTDGTFLVHAITAASHNISNSISGVFDAFSY